MRLSMLPENSSTPDFYYYQTDLTNPDSVSEVFQKICKKTDSLDAIIHMAGMYFLDSLVEMEEKEWDQIFQINRNPLLLLMNLLPDHLQNQIIRIVLRHG